jgi:phosphoglycolate phosphatase-like HAD superfamily hydrolase
MSDSAEPSQPEIVRPDHPRGPFRCVVFDFDGTLSLLRGNWQGLMIPRMVEILADTGTGESQKALHELVTEFVTRLTGQPTMLQMEALCDEVARRGRPRPDAQAYLEEYLTRLLAQTARRIAAVRSGRVPADELLVPGSRPLVERLARQQLVLAISSGTELSHVQAETAVLGLDRFFGGRIFGPVQNDRAFSKQAVLEQLMAEHGLSGGQIACIGDGPAEMLAARAVGALAIGVASDEIDRSGRVSALKRDHLLRAGAEVIVADYRRPEDVLRLLGITTREGDGERERGGGL